MFRCKIFSYFRIHVKFFDYLFLRALLYFFSQITCGMERMEVLVSFVSRVSVWVFKVVGA